MGLRDAARRVQGGGVEVAERPATGARMLDEFEEQMRAAPDVDESSDASVVCGAIESCELEVVMGGALMKIRFRRGTNPAEVVPMLRALDPNVKVRDEFMQRGGGPREVKTATAMVIGIDAKGDYKRVTLTCSAGDAGVTVEVSKKNVDEFAGKVAGLGKLTAAHAESVAKAFADKGTATVILLPAEQFGVKYSEFNGRCFMEELVAEVAA